MKKIYNNLINKLTIWSSSKKAVYYLVFVSFSESSFFPIPPDVILAPMVLNKPKQAWRYAIITTLSSVLGGILGYYIGHFCFDIVYPYIERLGYANYYWKINNWFQIWGFTLTFLCGLMPIPYKVFAIAAGATNIPIVPFIFGSLVGRGLRFSILTTLLLWGGPKIKDLFAKYTKKIFIALILLIMIIIVLEIFLHIYR